MRLLLLALLFAFPALAKKKPPSLVDQAATAVGNAFTESPRDNEVCFSPDEGCDVKLWKFIQSAKKSIDVAIFDLTHPKIAHELLVASKKIPVRVVVDRRQSKGQHSLVSLLLKGGIDVKVGRQRGIMHNKFIIVDGARLITGSFNFTTGASEKNNENQVYLATPEIVGRYRDRFEKIWTEARPASREVASE